MPDRVVVVGSRMGFDLQEVTDFLVELRQKRPDTIVVSGGASQLNGAGQELSVDAHAEKVWLSLGGRVESYRAREVDGEWGVELWRLGRGDQSVELLPESETMRWKKRVGALFCRNWLMVEGVPGYTAPADHVVSFQRHGGSIGTMSTLERALGLKQDCHPYYSAERRAA